jgi:hypothetical protein
LRTIVLESWFYFKRIILNKLLLVPLLFATFFTYAQEPVKTVKISGHVMDSETSEPVPFVHIINLTANQGLTTNHKGEFYFTLSPNDTLVFSSVGYEKHVITLDQLSQDDKMNLKIDIKPSTTVLEGVEVVAGNPEAFKKEFLALELPDRPERIMVPGAYDGPRRDYKPSVLNPVSFVYSMFDKKAKERIKLVQVQQETERWGQLRRKYDFIKDIADIDDEELEEFLAFCHMDLRQIEFSTEYDLAVAVNRCLPDYKAVIKK